MVAKRSEVHGVRDRLANLLDLPVDELRVEEEVRLAHGRRADAVIHTPMRRFVAEIKRSASAASVLGAIEQLQQLTAGAEAGVTPLVVVPYMGEVGQRLCAERGIAWLDLSGNAVVVAPGLHIRVEGRPNRFKRRGRPQSAFAPKSSRIARWLLMHPERALTQRELAEATGMDEGFTSRIVAGLEEDGLIVRDEAGRLQVRDPNVVLDAWREDYDFAKHYIVQGHIPARSGDEVLRDLCTALEAAAVEHAATGLAGAWVLTHFAGFRLVTVFVRPMPPSGLLDRVGFREDPRGANVWLVVPRDEGVFQGAETRDGVRCVHPVQVYLDLKGHPERAREAAEKVRAEHMKWRKDA